MIAAPDGSQMLRVEETSSRSGAADLGRDIAHRLLAEGGRVLLQR
jgi:porphobilinogen deaminase